MTDVNSIAFALDPTNVPSFLLDWEVTKLCNLDCTYCSTGLEGGHDNTTAHPPLSECLDSIDFMYQYVDLYMQHKRANQRKVILNVYGGESLFHPDIVEILEQVRIKHQPYDWNLTVTCTTNAVIGKNLLDRILSSIDEFTVTFHAEGLDKQREQVLANLLDIHQRGVRVKCVVLMHNHPTMWARCQSAIAFCKLHDIKYIVKPLDNIDSAWAYSQDQIEFLRPGEQKIDFVPSGSVIKQGRQCCGGRLLSTNGNLKSRETFVAKQGFTDWHCSVNWFFLFVRQLDGAVYTNKDCMTSTTGLVEPLGYIDQYSTIISQLERQLSGEMPVIKCVKPTCRCGYCAPKAQHAEDFTQLMNRYIIDTTLKIN